MTSQALASKKALMAMAATTRWSQADSPLCPMDCEDHRRQPVLISLFELGMSPKLQVIVSTDNGSMIREYPPRMRVFFVVDEGLQLGSVMERGSTVEICVSDRGEFPDTAHGSRTRHPYVALAGFNPRHEVWTVKVETVSVRGQASLVQVSRGGQPEPRDVQLPVDRQHPLVINVGESTVVVVRAVRDGPTLPSASRRVRFQL